MWVAHRPVVIVVVDASSPRHFVSSLIPSSLPFVYPIVAVVDGDAAAVVSGDVVAVVDGDVAGGL